MLLKPLGRNHESTRPRAARTHYRVSGERPGPIPSWRRSERWPCFVRSGTEPYPQVYAAAHLAAAVWTITATAERNNREPLTYLSEYLQACAIAGGKPPEGE